MFDRISHRVRAHYLIATVLTLAGLISWLAVITSTASTGTPSFAPATNFSAGTNPYAVVAGDFNGDSKLDLAVANYDSGNVSIFIGNGSGGFNAPANFTVGTHPRALATGYFNADTKLDLAVANEGSNNVSILI